MENDDLGLKYILKTLALSEIKGVYVKDKHNYFMFSIECQNVQWKWQSSWLESLLASDSRPELCILTYC